MKKLFAALLAVMMIMALAAPAYAADETGTITINGVSESNVYSIYRLLDLESYNYDTGAYSYKVNAAWTGFFATSDALAYVAIDEAGYVTWITGEDDDTVAAFAKIALAYAEDNGIGPVKSSKNDGEFVITPAGSESEKSKGVFSDLELGYYLVDSTMGALCGLTTTNPNASINAKNGSPTIDKQVKEDSTDQWGDSNSLDIGQTVEFRVTINVHAGAQNYVLHDKMAEGLTFSGVSKIERVIPSVSTTTVDPTMYTVKTGAEVSEEEEDEKCTFEVHFSQDLCNELETNDKLIVYYSATLNEKAIIAGANKNTAWLDYGEDHETEPDSTDSNTYGIDIVKTDSQYKLIDGAQFRIYDALTGGNEIPVVLEADGTYRRAMAGEAVLPSWLRTVRPGLTVWTTAPTIWKKPLLLPATTS